MAKKETSEVQESGDLNAAHIHLLHVIAKHLMGVAQHHGALEEAHAASHAAHHGAAPEETAAVAAAAPGFINT